MVAGTATGRSPAKEDGSVRRIVAAAVSLTLVSTIASWAPSAASSTPPAAGPVDLSVMTFNIFYGGDELDLQTGDFCEVADGSASS